LSLLHQLKHVNTNFDDLKDMILKDKECSDQPKKFEDVELQTLLDENNAQ